MNTSKIIKAYIGAGTYSTTEPITQGDYGYILQIEGTVLPATYRVDFANRYQKNLLILVKIFLLSIITLERTLVRQLTLGKFQMIQEQNMVIERPLLLNKILLTS